MIKICSNADSQKGSIMLEGVFGVLASMFVLFFLLSFGLYLYQQTLVGIVTNEVAEEIATTYKYLDVSENSTIALENVTSIGRYRYLLCSGRFDQGNKQKGESIATAHLSKTSLALSENSLNVSIKKVSDDVGRVHFEVTLSDSYDFMLGGLLDIVGIDTTDNISRTAIVESVDILNYVNSVKTVNYFMGKADEIPILNTISSVIGTIRSVAHLFGIIE